MGCRLSASRIVKNSHSQRPNRADAASTGLIEAGSDILELHDLHRVYHKFEDFAPQLPSLLERGRLLEDCAKMIHLLGIIEPLSERHIPPDEILISPPNYRESVVGGGCISRHRAILRILSLIYNRYDDLNDKKVFLPEAVTGFAQWWRGKHRRLTLSEYLEGAEDVDKYEEIASQDLCRLTFHNRAFDIVICSEIFEHVHDLKQALGEIHRVLDTNGRLLATFPMAFGQQQTIVKAIRDPISGEVRFLNEAEFHGDPIRPSQGAVVYQIPGWDILTLLRAVGFETASIHLISSWKYGVLGGDLPGVLVLEAQKG